MKDARKPASRSAVAKELNRLHVAAVDGNSPSGTKWDELAAAELAEAEAAGIKTAAQARVWWMSRYAAL